MNLPSAVLGGGMRHGKVCYPISMLQKKKKNSCTFIIDDLLP